MQISYFFGLLSTILKRHFIRWILKALTLPPEEAWLVRSFFFRVCMIIWLVSSLSWERPFLARRPTQTIISLTSSLTFGVMAFLSFSSVSLILATKVSSRPSISWRRPASVILIVFLRPASCEILPGYSLGISTSLEKASFWEESIWWIKVDMISRAKIDWSKLLEPLNFNKIGSPLVIITSSLWVWIPVLSRQILTYCCIS